MVLRSRAHEPVEHQVVGWWVSKWIQLLIRQWDILTFWWYAVIKEGDTVVVISLLSHLGLNWKVVLHEVFALWTYGFLFHSLAGLSKCEKEQKTALGPFGNAPPGRFAPECDPDGQYNNVQCYYPTGYCWCVDSLGREIPGTRTKEQVKCPEKGLSNT